MILRGCVVGALGAALGLAVVADVADIGARHLATGKVEQRIRQVVPHASGVHGRIRSFPFLAATVTGHVHEVSATIDRLPPYSDLFVDLRDSRVSEGTMVTALRVDVTHVDRGALTFHLTDSGLQQAAPSFASGRPTLTVDAAHRMLVITSASSRPVTVALPPTSVVPCVPTVQPVTDGYALACVFRTVPAAFQTP